MTPGAQPTHINDSMRIIDAILKAERLLRTLRVTDTPRLEAEVLLSDTLHVNRAKLISSYTDTLDDRRSAAFFTRVKRRADGEPIAYIIGKKEFMGFDFRVDRRALIPRPETELLVERAAELIRAGKFERPKIMDIGTGCGCIAISLARVLPRARVFATDVSMDALELARLNAKEHRVSDRVTFLLADVFDGLPKTLKNSLNGIISNPPYVSDSEYLSLDRTVRGFEPPAALRAGVDGLDYFRRIVAGAPYYLVHGGFLAVEIGGCQAEDALEIMGRTGSYDPIEIVSDLAGKPRVIIGGRAG